MHRRRAEMLKSWFGDRKQSEAVRPAPRVPAGVRVYAIGDIHGRSDLLDRMHALINADLQEDPVPSAHVVYLGDYIDRGPDSYGVLERLATGQLMSQATLLSGNHEQMLLQFLEDESAGFAWRRLGGLETMLSYGVVGGKAPGLVGLSRELKASLPAHHLKFLRRLKKTVAIGDYFFCHAGVRPGVPLERQRDEDVLWIRGEFLWSTADFGKIVVHGHSPVDKPDFRSNRINIDTRAYATGRLTCLVLDGAERRVFST
jgi:serine/threonine protein phosphatase 1